MRILPSTGLARAGCAVALVAFAAYVAILVLAETWIDRSGGRMFGLAPLLLAMVIGSVLALVAAVRGERSLLTWIALVPGALVTLALLAEATGLIE